MGRGRAVASCTSRADLGKGAAPSDGPGWAAEAPAERRTPELGESKTEGLPVPKGPSQDFPPKNPPHPSPGPRSHLTCSLLLPRSLARPGLVLGGGGWALTALRALAGPRALSQPLPLGRLALGDLPEQLPTPGLAGLGRQGALLLEALLLLALEGRQSLRSKRGCDLGVQVHARP